MNPPVPTAALRRLPRQLAAITGLCTLATTSAWAWLAGPGPWPLAWQVAAILLAAGSGAGVAYSLARGLLACGQQLAEATASAPKASLGGEEKEVTILFCDIRRFTALAEQMPATEVVKLLNTFFSRMIQVVHRHGGTVDKLMGDSVMALFGVPTPTASDPLQAIRCALVMHQALAELNRERSRLNLPPIEMGIGINSGSVVAGNIGSIDRMDYTVIGDNVNIAARLQGIAAAGETLVSDATFAKVASQVSATPLQPAQLKGRQHQVAIYRIDCLAPDDTPTTLRH